MYIAIQVKSSDKDNHYKVRFYFKNGRLSVFCSCPAGAFNKYCKHKLALLSGDDNILFDVSEKEDFLVVQDWIAKTDYSQIIKELKEAVKLLKDQQSKVRRIKEKLEDKMKGK